MKGGHCARRFPQPIHHDTMPMPRECGRRYCYYCPRECDRFTVPYLPDLALLFDAHVNLVKVVAEEWSAYLLKYAAKPPPAGVLHLSPQELFKLGFIDVDVHALAVATQFATTHVYQPAELALLATDTAVFRISRIVIFVDLRPPERRTHIVSERAAHARPRISSQQAYGDRPNKVHRNVSIANMVCVTFHRCIMTLSRSETKRLPGKFNRHKWQAAQAAWGATHVDPALCPVDADAAEALRGVPAEVRELPYPTSCCDCATSIKLTPAVAMSPRRQRVHVFFMTFCVAIYQTCTSTHRRPPHLHLYAPEPTTNFNSTEPISRTTNM